MKQIVVLDGSVANPGDLTWDPLHELGEVIIHDRTEPAEIIDRALLANIVLTNKCQLTSDILEQLPNLEYIGLLATGYNNIDLETTNRLGITVCNARGYGAPSVAQHVFALLLELTNQVGLHNQAVKQNKWANSQDWSFWNAPIIELYGKTLGIYGLGTIGEQVAQIGLAFGMNVIATRKNPAKGTMEGVALVSEGDLLSNSDVMSLHAALSTDNFHFINTESIRKMKPTAFLINTGRGDLINEADLKLALESGKIAGAALDVLHKEPPPQNHPLTTLENCIITPHHAWASKESRERMLSIVFDNIKSYLSGNPTNVCTS